MKDIRQNEHKDTELTARNKKKRAANPLIYDRFTTLFSVIVGKPKTNQ
jgi:hypothetical protein